MTSQPSDRIRLASWPTPLEPAPRLAGALGLGPDDLWIKRDDLTGLAGGGNKIRKLEWTVAAAIAAGADALVTTGAPQSNHARLTAAAGARLGLRVVLVFPGDPGGAQSGNLALDGLLGARIAWAGDVGLAEAADAVVAQLRAEGGRPALIPFGGSSGVGARGYVACARELQQQLPDLDTVVVALGSGGTMAGLVAALGPDKVLGIDTGAMPDPCPRWPASPQRPRNPSTAAPCVPASTRSAAATVTWSNPWPPQCRSSQRPRESSSTRSTPAGRWPG